MALKRINKELTDLGRYVIPHQPTGGALMARMTRLRNPSTAALGGQ